MKPIPERVEEMFKIKNGFFPSGEHATKRFTVEDIRKALTETDQQARESERLRIKVMLEEMPAFTSCSDKTMGQVSDEAKKPAYGTNYLQREAVLLALSNPPSQV